MSPSDPTDIVYTGTRAPTDTPAPLEVHHRPLLEVSPLDVDHRDLAELTEQPTALVVFSKNAVRSLRHNDAQSAVEPLSRHDWWAVGRKTAAFLRDVLGVRASYPEAQRFEGLRSALAEADLPDRVVAFTLEGTSRDLSPILDDRGIEYIQFPVYRTEPVDYPDLDELVGDAQWFILTSPKGIDSLAGIAPDREELVDRMRSIHVAAIGPKTARAARNLGLDLAFVPPEPDRDALLRKIAAMGSSGYSESDTASSDNRERPNR